LNISASALPRYCRLPDLYILGAFGEGRKQVQILNRQDDCCFGQKQHAPARDYASDMHLLSTLSDET